MGHASASSTSYYTRDPIDLVESRPIPYHIPYHTITRRYLLWHSKDSFSHSSIIVHFLRQILKHCQLHTCMYTKENPR
jgi:hypothetical protein